MMSGHGGHDGSVAGSTARQLLDKYLLAGGRWQQPPEVEEIAPEATAVSDTAVARSTDFRRLPADLQT